LWRELHNFYLDWIRDEVMWCFGRLLKVRRCLRFRLFPESLLRSLKSGNSGGRGAILHHFPSGVGGMFPFLVFGYYFSRQKMSSESL